MRHRIHRRFSWGLWIALVVALLTWTEALQARHTPPQPSRDEVRLMAAQFAELLASRQVMLPDGTLARVLADAGPSTGNDQTSEALLTRERIVEAFDTISEARAWNETWLIVQDKSRDLDLIVTVERGSDGVVQDPTALFTAPRADWTSSERVDRAFQKIRGERMGRRIRNVVTVEFAVKEVVTYVYQVKEPQAGREGLAAMLPPGSLVREARTVNLGDGVHRTLALVLQDATFEPSDCTSCESRLFGHADSGRVLLVLTGPQAVEQTLDLTPHFFGVEGKPLIPRFACREGDEQPDSVARPLPERFEGRESVPVLVLQDLDQDGAALEFSLPARFVRCGESASLIAGVDRATGKLEVQRVVEERP